MPFGSSILTILFIEVRIIPKYSSAFATMLFEIIHQAWNVECSSFFMDFNLIFLLCFFSLSFEGSSLLFHAEVSFKSSDSLTMDIKSSLSSLMEINKGKEMKKSLFLLFAYSFNAGSSS